MKIVTLCFLIIGAFIGASFASGREIYVYFARFGFWCIPMAIVAGILLYFIMNFFLNYKTLKKKSLIFIIFEIVLLIATFVLSSTMFAGCLEISNVFDTKYLIIFTLCIALLQCFIDIKGLKFVNWIMLPAIFVCLIICIASSKWGVEYTNDYMKSTISAFQYVGTNSILLSIFLMQIGGQYSRREKKIASIIVTIVLTLFVLFISLTLMGQSEVQSSSMPLVTFALSQNIAFGKVLCIIVWFGLITTLLSGLYVLCNYVKNNSFFKVLIVVACYVTAFLGWDILTTQVYSFIGLISMFSIISVICDYYTKRKICNQNSLEKNRK